MKLLLALLLCSLPAFSQCASATRFLVPGGDGIWADTNNWAASSGGSSGASVPVSTTIACADANSGTVALTLNANAQALSFDTTNFLGSFAYSTHQLSIFSGSLIWGSGVTITAGTGAQLNFKGTSGGATFTPGPSTAHPIIQVDTASAVSVTLEGNIAGSVEIELTLGTLLANGYNVTTQSVVTNGTTGIAVTLGPGIWTMTGLGGSNAPWNFPASSNAVVTPNGATLTFTDTSSTKKLWADGTGTNYTGTIINLPGGTGGFYFDSSASETLGTVNCAAGGLVIFQSTYTYTIGHFNCNGTSGNNVTIENGTASSATTIAVTGTVCLNYITIPNTTLGYVSFTGGTVYAQNSSIGTHATGITSGACPANAVPYIAELEPLAFSDLTFISIGGDLLESASLRRAKR